MFKRNLITICILIIFCFVIQAAVHNSKWGKNTEISELAYINKVHIGDNCKIMSFVSIGEKDVGNTDEVVIIGDNTIIEPHVVISKGVRIGSNCIIRSGSIITGDISDSTEVSIETTLNIINL